MVPHLCDSCHLAGVICWVSSKFQFFAVLVLLSKECSISAEREFSELVEAHRSLKIQIDQARERLEDACANFEIASKEFNFLCEQKKSLTSIGISGMRAASRTENVGSVQQVPSLNPLTEPFNPFPLLLPEEIDPILDQFVNSNS